MKSAIVAFAVCTATAIKVKETQPDPEEPLGPGQQEKTKAIACQECEVHAEYLGRLDPCVCHGQKLSEGWVWSCRPAFESPKFEMC